MFVAMLLAVMALNARANSLAGDEAPVKVLDGAIVPECAWPTAGIIYTDNDHRCSAVYVGGRVILTASHCVTSGFQIPTACDVDTDCPDVSALGGAIELHCDAVTSTCVDPDPLISSQVGRVRFGIEYPSGNSEEETRKSIQILYCHKKDSVTDDLPGGPGDFAYCVLADEPNFQAIPIAVPCETAAELVTGTQVVAVGYGQSALGGGDSGGVKRWATATLPNDTWSTETISLYGNSLEWTTAGGVEVSNLGSGDSGGPLFAQMSDGTWRVIGITQTNFPEWVIPFHHIGWILADPNIEVEDILPCHDAAGAWVGGVPCGVVPTQPDQSSGAWARGEHSCHTDAVVQTNNLCPPEIKEDPAPQGLVAKPERGAVSSESSAGCRMAWGEDRQLIPLLLIPLIRRKVQ